MKSYTITCAALSPAFYRLNTQMIFSSSNFGLFLPLSDRCVPAHPSRGPESERHRCDRRPERRVDLCHRWGAKTSDTVEEKQSVSELLEPGGRQCKIQLTALSLMHCSQAVRWVDNLQTQSRYLKYNLAVEFLWKRKLIFGLKYWFCRLILVLSQQPTESISDD